MKVNVKSDHLLVFPLVGDSHYTGVHKRVEMEQRGVSSNKDSAKRRGYEMGRQGA